MGELPNAVVKRLIAKHGGGLRVSGSALDLAVAAAEEEVSPISDVRGSACYRRGLTGVFLRRLLSG